MHLPHLLSNIKWQLLHNNSGSIRLVVVIGFLHSGVPVSHVSTEHGVVLTTFDKTADMAGTSTLLIVVLPVATLVEREQLLIVVTHLRCGLKLVNDSHVSLRALLLIRKL